jgi:hypothetical protein
LRQERDHGPAHVGVERRLRLQRSRELARVALEHAVQRRLALRHRQRERRPAHEEAVPALAFAHGASDPALERGVVVHGVDEARVVGAEPARGRAR